MYLFTLSLFLAVAFSYSSFRQSSYSTFDNAQVKNSHYDRFGKSDSRFDKDLFRGLKKDNGYRDNQYRDDRYRDNHYTDNGYAHNGYRDYKRDDLRRDDRYRDDIRDDRHRDDRHRDDRYGDDRYGDDRYGDRHIDNRHRDIFGDDGYRDDVRRGRDDYHRDNKHNSRYDINNDIQSDIGKFGFGFNDLTKHDDSFHQKPKAPDCRLVRCAAPTCSYDEELVTPKGKCCPECRFDPFKRTNLDFNFKNDFSIDPNGKRAFLRTECADDKDILPPHCAAVSCFEPSCPVSEESCVPKGQCCPVCVKGEPLRTRIDTFDNPQNIGFDNIRDNEEVSSFRDDIFEDFNARRDKRFNKDVDNPDCREIACIQVILNCEDGYVFDTPKGECCPSCIPEKKRGKDDGFRKIDADFSQIERLSRLNEIEIQPDDSLGFLRNNDDNPLDFLRRNRGHSERGY